MTSLLVASVLLNAALARELRIARQNAPVVRLSIGSVMREIEATNLSGETEHIKFGGSLPTILYVFSRTCKFCDHNVQNIRELARRTEGRFRVVGLAIGTDPLPQVREHVERHYPGMTIYHNVDFRRATALGVNGTPQTIVISIGSTVLKNWPGAYSAQVQSEIEAYFSVKLPGLNKPNEQQLEPLGLTSSNPEHGLAPRPAERATSGSQRGGAG